MSRYIYNIPLSCEPELLEELRLTEDHELHRLMQTYPRRVLPFMTKLEVLE